MLLSPPESALSTLLDAFDAGVTLSAPLEARLENAYHRELNRLVKIAARNFARHAITASALEGPQPAQWKLPDIDEVLPEAQVVDALTKATEPTRVKIVSTMMGGALASVGVGFDVQNPLATNVLDGLGHRITEISGFTRASIMASLSDSFDKGLSIPHAAREMAKTVSATNVTRAKLIARTEFIGAQNASSLASVQYSGAAKFKVWLATGDSRTRPDHAAASGQTVPLSHEFDVGGYSMQHPGDQNAPAGEVCNCRCTMTYTDTPGQDYAVGTLPTGPLPAPPVAVDEPIPVLPGDATKLAAQVEHTPGPSAIDLAAIAKKHPIGATRNFYKKGKGYNLGPHKILEHTEDGMIVVENAATNEITTVGAHELKKPNKAKVAPAPVTTNPLIPQAHAVVKPLAQTVSEAEFPLGAKYQSDYGEVEVVGHTPSGHVQIKNLSTGGTSTVSAGFLEDAIVPVAKHHPVGGESISAQALSVGDQITTKLYGDPVDVQITEISGDIVTYEVKSGPYKGFPGQGSKSALEGEGPIAKATHEVAPLGQNVTPVGSYAYYTDISGEMQTVKVVKHPTVESAEVQLSHGGTITVPQSSLKTIAEDKPGTLAKPHAPAPGVFEPKAGSTVSFENGYDPAHPYKSANAKPVKGGKGTVVEVDWTTNQVIVNAGTKNAPKLVQTHLSKLTSVKTGQKAEWKAGGGKPGLVAQSNVSHGYHQATSAYTGPQEYLPVPAKFTDALSRQDFNAALDHNQGLLDQSAKDAVKTYTGSAYRQLNQSLRGKHGPKTVPSLARQIDRAFEQIPPTQHNGILHRYTNLGNVESAQNLQVGQVIHDDGFLSTSTGTSNSGFGSDHLIIEVPKGSKVIDINKAGQSNVSTESEVLVDRGARMVVTSIDQRPYGREIHVRMVPKGYKASSVNPNV